MALDQGRVDGCHFDAAVFTNLTQDHLDYHGTMEHYLAAKKKLFAMCDRGVVNLDDAWAERLMEGLNCPWTTFSVGRDEADYTARNIHKRPDGVDFELVGTGEIDRVRLPIPGDFSVYNAMAAAACGLAVGLPFDKTVQALSSSAGVKGRAEIVPTGRDYTIVIDYAHTPDGLENICRTLKECAVGRLVVLFGCGGDRDTTKRPKMGAIAASYADLCIVTSDNPRSEDPGAIIRDILAGMPADADRMVIENRVEAIHWAVDHAQSGDTILLDDGLVRLTVLETSETEIRCRVENDGDMKNHKGVNVPGVRLNMPYMSQQDRDDLLFGAEQGFDYVAASFVRSAADVRELRRVLDMLRNTVLRPMTMPGIIQPSHLLWESQEFLQN